MKALNIGGLKINLPLVQGGMGVGVSLSSLASAVANEGGVGVISPAGIGLLYKGHSKDYLENCLFGLREEIRKARAKTKGVLGVNVMVALSNYVDLVKTSIKEGVDIIFSGAGMPLNLPEFRTENCKTKLVPIVSSARAASLICKKWKANYNCVPDAIVLEGPKAGGHLGFKINQIEDKHFALENLVLELREFVDAFEKENNCKIPIIAAGGIYNSDDVAKIMKCGADAVQLGTRFVTTIECDASDAFKQAYLEAKKEDVRIINSPVGMPGRAIESSFIRDVEKGMRRPKGCPVNCIRTCDIEKAPYCIIASLTSALKGNFDRGYAFAGANVWKSKEIETVKDVCSSLVEGFNQD
ncbi:MAG: NAD(P)H-dependent flavin oxidoreductase [Bacteroidales bacterium]